ncbi:MAG: hypothetical protein WKF96_01245 [Solirubrobacteraceae bacterium]
MTREEFVSGPAVILDGAWPGEFTDAEEGAYYFLLDDFTPEQVMSAIKALRGSRFRPAAGEIVEAIQGTDASRPTFDEVMAVLFFGRRSLLWAPRGGDPWPQIAEAHPLIGHFIARMGLERLRAMQVLDDEQGKWRVKELRAAWEAHTDVMAGRELTALVAGSGRGELARLDPLARLGLDAPVRDLDAGEAA